MIDADEAASAARQALAALSGPSHEAAIAAAASGEAGWPLFVTRMDRPDQSYYLVPWHDEQGIVLVVQIDADDGAMRSFALLPAPVGQLLISKEQAVRLVAESRIQVTGDAELVWKPCRESTSPLQPLWRVPVEGGERYVTAGGEVRDRLTELGRGG